MNKNKLLTLTLLLYLVFPAWSQATEISRMVILGDSLSDPGNYFALFGEVGIQPYEPDNFPSSPYAIGGMHFSNGATWIEQLTTELGIPDSGSPAYLAPGVFTNYAVGRARARSVLLDGVFSEVTLTTQVDNYLADTGNQAIPDALHVVWSGANDLGDALGVQLAGGDAGPIFDAAIGNTIGQIQRLYNHGARRFLLMTLPNFALTPRVRGLVMNDPASLALVSLVSAGYNLALTSNLSALQSFYEDMEVIVVDSFSLLNQVVADPAQWGLEEVDHACLVPDKLGKTVCFNRDQYLYWDAVHPTRKGHSIIAEEVLGILLAE